MSKVKSLRKLISLLCVFSMFFTLALSVSAQEAGSNPVPGVASIIWDMADEIGGISHGSPVNTGVISSGGNALLSLNANTVVQEVHGWDYLAKTVDAVTVTRSGAGDSMRFNPEALGMEDGQIYIWEIEGYRTGTTSANHRAALGAVNSSGVTSNLAAATMASNSHPYRPGYFFMKVIVSHSTDTAAYSFYGVGSSGTTAAAGGFVVTGVTLKKANPYVIFESDFSDGTSGIIDASQALEFFGVVPDSANPENSVLQAVIPASSAGGHNSFGYTISNDKLQAPSGATYRVTIVARRTATSSSNNTRLRVATNTGGTVSWEAVVVDAAMAAAPGWTTYTTGIRELAAGTSIQAIQLIRQNINWTGTMEMDSVKVEIIEAPAEEIDAQWESGLMSLKDQFADYFTVGNIMDKLPSDIIEDLFLQQYNSLTLENRMKPGSMSSAKGVYNFEQADEMAAWAEANGVQFIGHCLLWHSQSANWLTASDVDYYAARENLKEFISTIAGHFAGKVYAWDVVNEVMNDGGNANNPWYTNIRSASSHPWRSAYGRNTPEGANDYDFIYDAFVFTRQADPNAKLQYNDYNDDNSTKSKNIANMINSLNLQWARDELNNPQANAAYTSVQEYINNGGRVLIEIFGMQSHYGSGTSITNIKNALQTYSTMTGVTLSVTELDITAGSGNSYNPGPQRQLYNDIFKLYMANAHLVSRVTFWGMNDSTSWRSTNNPTLFAKPTLTNPFFTAKPAFHDVVSLPYVYSAPGLSASFQNGSKNAVIKQNEVNNLTIILNLEGGLTFAKSTLDYGDYRVTGLPFGVFVSSAQIIDPTTAVLTLTGTPSEIGHYESIRVELSKYTVAGDNLGDIAGDVVATRVVQSLSLDVEVTDTVFLSDRAGQILSKGLSTSNLPLVGKVLTLVIDGREYVLSTNANNRNISGEIALSDGGVLVFDIKGNGSNVKVFKILYPVT